MNLHRWHHFGKFQPVWLALMACLTALPFLASDPAPSQSKSNEQLVRDFGAAFNKHDVAAMAAMVAEDVQWMSINGDKIEIEVAGKLALEKWLTGYFKSCASCRSTIESLITAGNRIMIYEQARWETQSGAKSQKSLSVYEIANERIRRVWYFPSEK